MDLPFLMSVDLKYRIMHFHLFLGVFLIKESGKVIRVVSLILTVFLLGSFLISIVHFGLVVDHGAPLVWPCFPPLL